MTVLVLTAVKPGLRGELSKWMIEPRAGVFVGHVSSRIRDRLWEKIIGAMDDGAALMVYSARTEQGFALRSYGDNRRVPVDYDGLTLIRFLREGGMSYFESQIS